MDKRQRQQKFLPPLSFEVHSAGRLFPGRVFFGSLSDELHDIFLGFFPLSGSRLQDPDASVGRGREFRASLVVHFDFSAG